MLGYMRYFDIYPKRGKNSNEDGMSFKSHARFKVVSTDEDISIKGSSGGRKGRRPLEPP
jgi:hypothetical protein